MQIEAEAFLAIVGMAAVTYLTRIGGFWLIGRFTLSKRAEVWLHYIPGCVLIAIVAPDVERGGPEAWGATLVAIAVAARTKSLPVAMVCGVGTLLLLRLFTGNL